MKVWVSCWQEIGGREEFELHAHEPYWNDNAKFVGGGNWHDSSGIRMCRLNALEVLAEWMPEPGEVVEIELNPTTTWVME